LVLALFALLFFLVLLAAIPTINAQNYFVSHSSAVDIFSFKSPSIKRR